MKRFLTLAGAMMVVAGLSGAAVLTYTDKTAFDAAVGGGFSTFEFTGNFDSTPAGNTVNMAVSASNTYSGIVNNQWRDVLSTGNGINAGTNPNFLSSTTVTWDGPAMTGVGGLWDTSPEAEGGKIFILLNLLGGGTIEVPGSIGPLNGFFGWTSDTPFESFVLSTRNNLGCTNPDCSNFMAYGAEHYTLDNLQIAAVPEPATLSVVGLALLGLGVIRRRRS